MTKRHTGHVLSVALETLTKSPLNQADSEALLKAATAFWYSKSNLSAELTEYLREKRSQVELRRAGYLLERLTRFSCVTKDRLSEAAKGIELLRGSAADVKAQDVARRADALAVRWGLDEGLGSKVQELLPYQTRHYEAEQRR